MRNLSFQTKEDELQAFFEKFGTVQSVNIVQRDGRSKGIGFVEFDSVESAKKALDAEELELDGRKLGVSYAENKRRDNDRII